MIEYDFCDCCTPMENAFALMKQARSLDNRPLSPEQQYFTSPEKRAAFMRMIAAAAGQGGEESDMGADTDFAEQLHLDRQMAKASKKPFHGYNPNKHAKTGGLNAKGRAAAKRKTGANLKPPVTTKPSKLKPGSKKAKRRKSFCARMSGVKGPTSKKGKLTPKGAP